MSVTDITARIFLSYSRSDAAYAAEVRAHIEAAGLSLWQDVTHLESGAVGGWWDQIVERLEKASTEHLVLLVSSESLASGVVADEWRFSRRHGVEVHLLKVPNNLAQRDFAFMPAGMKAQHLCDFSAQEQANRLIAALKGPSRQLKVPMMAPAPDEHFVLRPEESAKLTNALLGSLEQASGNRGGRAVGITAALRGAGGYGKTQLARWLCQQERIVDHFYDGILWIEIGENPDVSRGLLSKVEFLIKALRRSLTDEDRGFPDATAASQRLFELLEKGGTKDKGRYLLVIDDAWRKSDVDLFMGGAPNTVRLVTTRIDDTLPIYTDKIAVDAMKPAEAVELLAIGLDRLPAGKGSSDRVALDRLATRLGEWALLLSLANGLLRKEIEAGSALCDAVTRIENVYNEIGLTGFDPKDETQRSRAATLSISASLRRLDPDEVQRFDDLAIFPEDEDIPIATIKRYWKITGQTSDAEADLLVGNLKNCSLLMSLDRKNATLRLHDVMRKFLRDNVGAPGLVERHRAWLAAYHEWRPLSLAGTEQMYFYRRCLYHAAEAAERSMIDRLLTSPAWLQGKLYTLNDPHALVGDFEQCGLGDFQEILRRLIRIISGILGRDKRQFLPQLIGRLSPTSHPSAKAFLEAASELIVAPAIIPQTLALVPPSTELMRLDGHRSSVTAFAVLKDGRLVSSDSNSTVIIWDPINAKEDARISSEILSINALAALPDGRLAFAGGDPIGGRVHENNEIVIWDVAAGKKAAVLKGHSECINALAVLPNGRLVSASGYDRPDWRSYDIDSSEYYDFSIRIWDVDAAKQMGRLRGHTNRITSLAVLPDGKLASVSSDQTVRIWNLETLQETAQFWQPNGLGSNRLLTLPNGNLLSVGYQCLIWDVARGVAVDEVKREATINDVAILLPGDKIACTDVWGVYVRCVSDHLKAATLQRTTTEVTALAALPNGRLVSGEKNGDIRVWEVEFSDETPRIDRHSMAITAIAVLSRNRIASASRDHTIRLWDAVKKSQTTWMYGRDCKGFSALAMLPDGRLVSGSDDGTIRLWIIKKFGCYLNNPIEAMRLRNRGEGNRYSDGYPVSALAVLSDGRLVTGCQDGVIRLWDLTTIRKFRKNREATRLEGHSARVVSLARLRDGRLASAGDMSVRLWDVATLREIPCCESMERQIFVLLAALPDGQLAIGGSGPVRLWSMDARLETGRLAIGTKALCVLSSNRLVTASWDRTVRIWDLADKQEICRFEIDALPESIAALPDGQIVVGDTVGNLHWLSVLEEKADTQSNGRTLSLQTDEVLFNFKRVWCGLVNESQGALKIWGVIFALSIGGMLIASLYDPGNVEFGFVLFAAGIAGVTATTFTLNAVLFFGPIWRAVRAYKWPQVPQGLFHLALFGLTSWCSYWMTQYLAPGLAVLVRWLTAAFH